MNITTPDWYSIKSKTVIEPSGTQAQLIEYKIKGETVMKTIKEMSFNELWTLYKVLGKVSKDADKLFEGQFNELLQQCADELYEGNLEDPVLLRALRNNLVSDKRTRFNNPEKYFNGYLPEKKQLLEFVDLLAGLLPSAPTTKGKPKVAGKARAKISWEYTQEDLGKLDADALKAWKDSISSLKSRGRDADGEPSVFYSDKAEALGMTDITAVAKHFDSLIAYANKQLKELTQPVISETLEAKLMSDGKTVLSAAEVAELRKLIQG